MSCHSSQVAISQIRVYEHLGHFLGGQSNERGGQSQNWTTRQWPIGLQWVTYSVKEDSAVR